MTRSWRRFAVFAGAHGAEPMPADPLLVGQYLSMIGNECCTSTVRTLCGRDLGPASGRWAGDPVQSCGGEAHHGGPFPPTRAR